MNEPQRAIYTKIYHDGEEDIPEGWQPSTAFKKRWKVLTDQSLAVAMVMR